MKSTAGGVQLTEHQSRLVGIGEGIGCAVEYLLGQLLVASLAPLFPVAFRPWFLLLAPALAAAWVLKRYGGTPHRLTPSFHFPTKTVWLALLHFATAGVVILAERLFGWGAFPASITGSRCWQNGPASFVLFVVVMPVSEEVAFRLALTDAMCTRGCPPWSQALVNSLSFGLMHAVGSIGAISADTLPFIVVQVAFATVLGWCFFKLDVLAGSVMPSVVLHVVNNLCSCPSMPKSLKLNTFGAAPVLFFFGMVAIEVVVYITVTRSIPRRKRARSC